MGVYEEKTEGRELMVSFSSKPTCCSSESVISQNNGIILIIIFIGTSEILRNNRNFLIANIKIAVF